MNDWNGFDKGVIGRKLPSDSTLNNMKKSELIELLHYAEHNHKVLAKAYQIAVDNSKCNSCPLSLNSKKVRAEAIEEELQEFAQWLWDSHYLVDEAFTIRLVEQYKEDKKKDNIM